MNSTRPTPNLPAHSEETRHAVCSGCPSLVLPGGSFDVAPRPDRSYPFDPAQGWRATAGGVPVCVHPHKVGLSPAPYATENIPLPWQAEPPQEASELESWLRAAITSAPPHVVPEVIERASSLLREHHPGVNVTAALRAALS